MVVGGENPTLAQTAIPGQREIYYGATVTESTTAWPSATVQAFESYIGQVSVTGTDAIKPKATSGSRSSVKRGAKAGFSVFGAGLVTLLLSLL